MIISIYLVTGMEGESAEYVLCMPCMEEMDDGTVDMIFLEPSGEPCEICGEEGD